MDHRKTEVLYGPLVENGKFYQSQDDSIFEVFRQRFSYPYRIVSTLAKIHFTRTGLPYQNPIDIAFFYYIPILRSLSVSTRLLGYGYNIETLGFTNTCKFMPVCGSSAKGCKILPVILCKCQSKFNLSLFDLF